MSVTDVTARIAQIQSQLAMLAPQTNASSVAFSSALESATDATAAGTNARVAPSGDAVVTEARRYLDVPYVWGGTDPDKGLDCSGLVQVVYKNLGYDLPRLSADQAKAGTPVASMADAQPGDLIAWDNSSRNNGADHIAIYVGNGKMIEAPRTGLNVRIVDVPSTPDYIRRIVPADGAVTTVSGARLGSGVSTSTPYGDLFTRAAEKYGVPAGLLSAVAKQESGYNPKAVSPAGAQGLMQLMPGTAKGLGVTNSFDPAQAVDGAARMLRDLTNRFGRTDLALAAYNAGPGAVLKYDGIPPYPETQRYVRNVLATMKGA
ncbi:MAG: transglycosylase SLT domain-containing protein [Propionibacteriales bacterium]|nr:transglycosylase SLT domain-containing protein [Propionibacteriales bacterium]